MNRIFRVDTDPIACDGHNSCMTGVVDGATVTLTGSATRITRGISGSQSISLSDLFASGRIISGAQFADSFNPASLVANTGAKSQ